MEAYKVDTVLKQGGTLVLENLPFRAGDHVEVIVVYQRAPVPDPRLSPASWPALQGEKYLDTGLHRKDMYDYGSSSTF